MTGGHSRGSPFEPRALSSSVLRTRTKDIRCGPAPGSCGNTIGDLRCSSGYCAPNRTASPTSTAARRALRLATSACPPRETAKSGGAGPLPPAIVSKTCVTRQHGSNLGPALTPEASSPRPLDGGTEAHLTLKLCSGCRDGRHRVRSGLRKGCGLRCQPAKLRRRVRSRLSRPAPHRHRRAQWSTDFPNGNAHGVFEA